MKRSKRGEGDKSRGGRDERRDDKYRAVEELR